MGKPLARRGELWYNLENITKGVKLVKPDRKVIRMLSLLGQFGFTLIFPSVALVLLTHWLNLPPWTTAVAVVVGLLAGISGGWRMLKGVMGKENEKSQPVRFDRHE